MDKTVLSDTINIRLKKEPERINPLIFPNALAREVYQYIHLPLADYDPETLNLSPILIKQLPTKVNIDTGAYAGGVYFDIEILDDAKWDDGSQISGEDYNFTVKSINLPLSNASKYREFAENIVDIKVDKSNNKKFKVYFKADYVMALETAINIEIYPKYFYDKENLLGNYNLSDFLSEHLTKINTDSTLIKFAESFNGNEFSRNLISGSGPYAFVSWTADQSIILEKKKDYWGQNISRSNLMQGPDKIVFHILPDEISAIAQLKSGSIDVINEISADSYKELSNDPKFKDNFSFYHPALMKNYIININNLDVKLSDIKVRNALAHLIDVDNIIQNLENGLGTRTVGPIHPIKKTFNKDLTPIAFDVEASNNLLKEAGWADTNKNGIIDKKINGKLEEMELEILISGQELGKKIALMLQESAAKVGVKITIAEKEFKQIRAENLKTRKYHLVPNVISQDIIPWDDLSKWHSSNDQPDGNNDLSYKNTITDELIDQILSAKNNVERIKIYRKIQEQIYIDQPAIFLYAPEEKIVISKKWVSSSSAKRPGYFANTFTLASNLVPSNN
jgi:peptide/nickel transport system substrate-binding protein